MLAATLRRAGACRRVTAFVSQTRSRSAFSRITALRRRAPLSSPMMTTTIAAASSASSSSSQAAAAAAATSTSTPPEPKQQRRRFPPLAPGSVAPEEYEARLEEKVDRVRSLLAGVLPSSRSEEPLRGGEEDGGRQQREPAPFPLEVFASADQGFRLRAEFRVWHDGGDLYYVMFDTVRSKLKGGVKEESLGGVGARERERKREKEDRSLERKKTKKTKLSLFTARPFGEAPSESPHRPLPRGSPDDERSDGGDAGGDAGGQGRRR
mgnify:FL=1